MLGLGIETSCDETSLAIVKNGTEIISLKVYSQTIHEKYKGIVPELAARAHLEKINILLDEVIQEANIQLTNLEYISVTAWPGLTGSLIIGAQLARTLSFTLRIPVIALDHLEAHLHAVRLENKHPTFPYLGMILSGGNSSIFIVKDFGNMKLIGDTQDDALGEAFDKVANLLAIGYPGGPAIEKFANEYSPRVNEKSLFPQILKDLPKGKIQFSYSGLKTSVMYHLKKNPLAAHKIPEICYHFQNTAFNLVERNIKQAVGITGLKTIVCAGGVLANKTLQNRLKELAKRIKIAIIFPENPILCTDNGAMVGSLGYYLLKNEKYSDLDFQVSPSRRNG